MDIFGYGAFVAVGAFLGTLRVRERFDTLRYSDLAVVHIVLGAVLGAVMGIHGHSNLQTSPGAGLLGCGGAALGVTLITIWLRLPRMITLDIMASGLLWIAALERLGSWLFTGTPGSVSRAFRAGTPAGAANALSCHPVDAYGLLLLALALAYSHWPRTERWPEGRETSLATGVLGAVLFATGLLGEPTLAPSIWNGVDVRVLTGGFLVLAGAFWLTSLDVGSHPVRRSSTAESFDPELSLDTIVGMEESLSDLERVKEPSRSRGLRRAVSVAGR